MSANINSTATDTITNHQRALESIISECKPFFEARDQAKRAYHNAIEAEKTLNDERIALKKKIVELKKQETEAVKQLKETDKISLDLSTAEARLRAIDSALPSHLGYEPGSVEKADLVKAERELAAQVGKFLHQRIQNCQDELDSQTTKIESTLNTFEKEFQDFTAGNGLHFNHPTLQSPRFVLTISDNIRIRRR
jgi:hypothetical protein